MNKTDIAEKIFKTSDIKITDPLRKEKKESIEKLKKLFTSNLNDEKRTKLNIDDSRVVDEWVRKGYYMEEVYFEDYHLTDALEDKKAFVKWFLEKYPEYNVPYDPQKYGKWRKGKKKIVISNTSHIWVNPYEVARERDLLFGTNGVEPVTMNNWREKIRDAQTKEEIENIEWLLNSEWSADEFVWGVKSYLNLFVLSMQNLKYELRKPVAPKYPDKEVIYFSEDVFKGAVEALEAKVLNEKCSYREWGGVQPLANIHREAGISRACWVARELLQEELQKVLEYAKRKGREKGVSRDWMVWPTTPKPEPVSIPPTSNKSPQQSDPKDLDSDMLDPTIENEAKKKADEIRSKLRETSGKIEKPDSPSSDNKNPQLSKEKGKENIRQLEEQVKELEGKDNGISSIVVAELKGQIEDLKKQMEEIKKSLKGMLEETKDYARQLFNYFKKENVKQITFEEDGSAKVEYEDNKDSKILSSQEIDNCWELKVLKNQVQQSEQKTLSRQELSQIIGSTSSPISTEKSHWENYKYYYFVGIGVVLLVIGGLAVYWLMRKGQKKQVE